MTIIRTIPEQTSFLGHFDVIGGHFSLLRIELFFKVHDIVQRMGHLIEFSAKKSPILFLYASINFYHTWSISSLLKSMRAVITPSI